MAKQAKVDANVCIGCGACVAIAAKSFKLGDDGKSHPVAPAVDDEETIQRAIEACPVSAISWEEE